MYEIVTWYSPILNMLGDGTSFFVYILLLLMSFTSKTHYSECTAGQFKSSTGNAPCTSCPDNSLSIKHAATECICSSGYYRSHDDGPDTPCTKPPSKPEMVQYIVDKTSVSISWSLPSYDGGRSDITYSISCLRCDSSYTLCSECGDIVRYDPSNNYLRVPQVTVSDLSPHTNYRFRIYSYNGVSSISGAEPKFTDAMLKTSEAAPSSVSHVRVVEKNSNSVLLKWESPSNPNGAIIDYELQYSNNDMNGDRISRSNRTKDQQFRIKYLPASTSFIVQVRARNVAGFGLFSSPIVFRTSHERETKPNNVKQPTSTGFRPPNRPHDKKPLVTKNPGTSPHDGSDDIHLVIGIVIACVLVMIVVASLLLVRGIKRRKSKHSEDIEVHPFFSNVADLLGKQNTISQRTYIDPSTYGDPDKAVREFAKEIDCFNIKKEELMGSGEFGEVYKGLFRPTTPIFDERNSLMMSTVQPSCITVAIKTLKSGFTEKQKEDFLTEASIMGQFDHPNVIRLEGVVTRSSPLMIVTEFMENGSLDAYLEDKHFKGIELDILVLVGMLKDIAEGMRYLAEIGYVHRDLAARNILVNDRLQCKVSDFGLSRVLENLQEEETAMYTTRGGMIPVRWTAPEAISKRTFTSSSDVWSFGIVMWEVLTMGERPYWEMPNSDVVHCVECGYRLPPPAFCPRVLHNLMLNCWNVDRTRRPTFSQMVTQLENLAGNPERLQDTINNIPVNEQAECIPESLDLSSLGQWLEDMNMTHYKEIMLRYGCVTAEQIIKLTENQMIEMGIRDSAIRQVLLNGAEFLRQRLTEIQNHGITV